MTTSKDKVAETQVAAPVVAYLQDLGWDVYQEVQVTGGQRADIVAVRGPLLWVVEAKVSMSLQLLDQVTGWIGRASFISIAVAKVHRDGRFAHPERHPFVDRYLRDLGISTFVVTGRPGSKYEIMNAQEYGPQTLHRKTRQDSIRAALHDRQKSQVAGSAGGGYWTPFRQTCDDLREFVAAHPGCKMKAAIDGIKHHYSTSASARSSLSHWIAAGKVQGITIDRGCLRLATLEAEPST
jgi:hypothetical protein